MRKNGWWLGLACLLAADAGAHPDAMFPPDDDAAPRWRTRAEPASGASKRGEAVPFRIDVGLSGFWYRPASSGQGFLFDVVPAQQVVSFAWFTHSDVDAGNGSHQRWFTGVGPYSGDAATLEVYLSEGGSFAEPPAPQARVVGSVRIRFLDCRHARLDYELRENALRTAADAASGPMRSGSIELERLTPSLLCEREAAAATPRYAFIGASVLTMQDDAELHAQTLLVEDGRIAALGPDGSVAIPPDAIRIDASGRWVMPGLVDFHTHERPFNDWPDDTAGNFTMYLANGVTSIVNMGDFTDALPATGARVEAAELDGPMVFAGLFARGAGDGGTASTYARTPDEGRALVQRAVAGGYDFVKLYSALDRTTFDAIASEAAARGIGIGGHLSTQVGYDRLLQGGVDFAVHAMEVLNASGATNDGSAIPGAVAKLAQADAALNATLFVYELIRDFGADSIAQRDAWQRVLAQEGIEYMDDRALTRWRRMYDERSDLRVPFDWSAILTRQRQLTRAAADAGVPIPAGTDDIGIPGVVPGFAIHGELAALTRAGLTPLRALQAATRDAGVVIERTLRPGWDTGVLRAGARADLLLLDADPRADLATLRRPREVMVGGRRYDGEALRARLEALRTSR
jgi:hypothetical protein